MIHKEVYIAGVGGPDRGGKDTLAKAFIEVGFFGFSFGDAVREHAFKRHKDKSDPISVANMTETANHLRTLHGADVILKQALTDYESEVKAGKQYEGIVLYSVRAPIEADFILEHEGDIFWVYADDQIRLKRRNDNVRNGESQVTMEQMLAQEALQTKPQPGTPVEAQMDLTYIKEHATVMIENNGNDLAAFEKQCVSIAQKAVAEHK